MLRFWVTVSLLVTVAFTGIGLLRSRQWGWSEYASNELYVVASERISNQSSFDLVNADGRGEEWDLQPPSGTVAAVACSPDGRTLAFITDSSRLYVVDHSGIKFEQAVLQGNGDFSVANNGSVVYQRQLISGASESQRIPAPEDREYSSPTLSSSGMLLWTRPPIDIVLTSARGEILWVLGSSAHPIWLASENAFTFIYPYPYFYGVRQFIADVEHHRISRLPFTSPIWIFSPDFTKSVIGKNDSASASTNLFLTSLFADDQPKQLTYKTNAAYTANCFLTFRPQMLIADKQ